MAESTSEETTVDRKLFEIFDEAFDLYNSFDTCNDPLNSPEFQVNRKQIKLLRNNRYATKRKF